MVENNAIISETLDIYKNKIGKDYNAYKNHIYRVLNICILLDTSTKNYKKYVIAAVFHDIGIWTHNFDYLDASITLAKQYLLANNLENWIDEISLMIENHHKIYKYTGKFINTVTVFQKADWLDVSNGIVGAKISKIAFQKIKRQFPNTNFHLFLWKQFWYWFMRNPFKPLPMFKW